MFGVTELIQSNYSTESRNVPPTPPPGRKARRMKMHGRLQDQMDASLIDDQREQITTLRADNAALRQMLRRLEWSKEYGRRCPECNMPKGYGHDKDCELARLLKEP